MLKCDLFWPSLELPSLAISCYLLLSLLIVTKPTLIVETRTPLNHLSVDPIASQTSTSIVPKYDILAILCDITI